MTLEYGVLDRKELRQAAEQVVLYTNSQKNLNFYLKRGYELFDERAFEYIDHKMESWSLKKVL